MKRKHGKSLLCYVLILCLLSGMLMNVGSIQSQAEEVYDVDEYGHEAEIPDSFKEAEKNKVNPYGQGEVNFNPVMELGVFQSDGNTVFTLDSSNRLSKKLFSTNDSAPLREKSDFYSAADVSKSSSGDGANLQWVNGVAFDGGGTGRKSYSAYYGFNGTNPVLRIYQKGNQTGVSYSIGSGYSWVSDVTYDTSSGFNSITAGDFNNDGRESVVLYDPNKSGLTLKEYTSNGYVSTYNIGKMKLFGENYTLNDIAGVDTKKTSKDRNIARVSLTAANVDGVDGDELIATVSLGNLAYVDSNKLTDRSSVLLVLKKSESGWKVVYNHPMSNVSVPGESNKNSHDKSGGWYMRSASSDVGDVDGDGALEIVTVGAMGDDRNHQDDDIRTDGTFAVITECGSSYETQTKGSFLGKCVEKGYDYIGYASDKYAQMGPVSMACVRFDGMNSQEYLVVRGIIFYLNEGEFTMINPGKENYRILNNVQGAYRPVVGNFDNNTSGREQIFWVQVKDKNNLQIAGYYNSGTGSLKDNTNKLRSCRYGIPNHTISSKKFVALTAVDVDEDDGMIIKYNSQQYSYADPEVMAILEAAPYFSDVADNVGYFDSTGSTSFGMSQSSSNATASSSSTRAGAYVSFEQDFSFFGVKMASVEAEASYEAEWSSEVEKETTYTYEMVFNGHQEDNSVVLIYTPVITYSYDVWNNNTQKWETASMDVAIAQKPQYKILTVDDYNAAAAMRNDPLIGDDILSSVPGHPETYRQNTNGLRNCVSASETYVELGEGSGSVESSVSREDSTSVTNSFTHSFDTKAGAGAGGVTIGASAGYSTSKATTVTNTEGVTRSGTVADVPKGCGDYSFKYKFATWDIDLQTGSDTYQVPVMGYVVKDVKQPPSLPTDVNAVSYSNKVDLDWQKGMIPAKSYEIYRYSDAELGGKQYFRIGTVDGSENPLAFTHENLEEGTIYEYSFRSVGADGAKSVYSTPISVMTTASSGSPKIITHPEDQSVQPGRAATFSITAVPSDINGALNFAWQKREAGTSAWNNIKGAEQATYTIPAEDVTLGLDGTQYRCMVSDWGNKQNPIFLYSKAATLNVGLADSTVTLHMEEDHGYADYISTEEGPERSETVTVYYEVTVGEEKLQCERYFDGAGEGQDLFYCIDDNKYYSFTDFSAGSENGQNRKATATGKQEWVQLDDYLVDSSGRIVTETSNLEPVEVPVTETINGEIYEVFTATDNIDEETLYYKDNVYYKKTETIQDIENENPIVTMTPMTEDEMNSYSLSQNMTDQEGEYYLYELEINESASLRLYEQNDVYYTKSDDAYVEYASLHKGYLAKRIDENSVDSVNKVSLPQTSETTVIIVKDVITTPHSGETVELSATVTSSGNNTGRITFHIVNTMTGEERVIKTTTNTIGQAVVTWTPSVAGVYNITASFAGNSISKATSSQVCVYYAMENESDAAKTGYDVAVPTEISYGNAFTPTLKSWSVKADGSIETKDATAQDISWKVYPYDSEKNGYSDEAVSEWNTTYTSLMPGNYMVVAEVPSDNSVKALVSKCIRVNKRKIVVSAPDSVSVDINNIESFDLSSYLDKIKIENEDNTPYNTLENDFRSLFSLTSSFNAADPVVGEYDINVSYAENTDDGKAEFLKRYVPEFGKGKLKVTTSLYSVDYKAGENGGLDGFNATADSSGFNSGKVMIKGSKLLFVATPDTGFKVDTWTVKVTSNNQQQTIDVSNTDGYRLKNDNTVLEVDSLSEDMEVSVTFVNENHRVSFNAGENGTLMAKQGNVDLISGTKVLGGSGVEFTANPKEGYVVKQWTVKEGDGQPVVKKNDDQSPYAKNTLILDNILSDVEVTVTFTPVEKYQVSYEALDLSGVSPIGIKISSDDLDADGKAEKGSAVTFKAELEPGVAIREWQTSTDGENWETKAKSQNSFTLESLQSDVKVRIIINNTASTQYKVEYKVCDMAGNDISGAGTLSANSNGISLNPVDNVAYIPIDFTFDEAEDYEVVKWLINDKESEELKGYKATSYHIDSLSKDTNVKVIVQKKSEVKLAAVSNGTADVKYQLDGKEVQPSEHGYVYSGTKLLVTLKPEKGFEVDPGSGSPANMTLAYTDEEKTDEMSYVYETIAGQNVTIQPVFKAIDTVNITYDTVITTGDSSNGSMEAAVSRKALEAYNKTLTSGADAENPVEKGNDVTFKATPDDGYRIQYWKVNGTIYKQDNLVYTEDTLVLSKVEEDTNVTVQFARKGDKTTVEVGDHGSLVSATVGNVDQTSLITDGIVLNVGVSVKLTVVPDAGYQVKEWSVNNEPVLKNENTYTYTSRDKDEAVIRVTFEQVDYSVSWKGADTNGTVTAQAGDAVYSGTNADIKGGTEVIFTANPEDGYQLDGWTINGSEVSGETEGVIIDGNTLTWTVPNGEIQNPKVNAFTVVAKFVKEIRSYAVSADKPENGTISAKANGVLLQNPDTVKEGTMVTFTAEPETGYQVIGWKVNDKITDSSSTTYSVTVGGDTNVTAIIKKSYFTVKYGTESEKKGTISATGGANGTVSVGYDKDVTFKAEPANYYYVKEWKLDGEKVTTGVSEDGLSFTLSNVMADHEVEAVLDKSISYEVNYGVEGDSASGNSVSAKIDETTPITKNETANVDIDSKITFEAQTETDGTKNDQYMVKEWKVNGETVPNNLSKTFTIDSLLKKSNVTVSFEPYEGFEIPSKETLASDNPSANGECEIDVEERIPDDTLPKTEVRRDGELTFTMKPEAGKIFTELNVYGVDCLKLKNGVRTEVQIDDQNEENPDAKPLANVLATAGKTSFLTVTENKDGSYTICVENVQKELKPSYELKTDIKEAKISVEKGETFIYNGKAQIPNAIKVTLDGKTLGEEDYDVSYQNNVNAGNAVIKVTGKGGYTGTATGAFVIQKKTVTIIADNQQKLYGNEDPALTYKAQGILTGDKIDVKLTRQAGENPGQYEILIEAAEKANYQFICQKGIFTIKDYKNPALTNALNQSIGISWKGNKLTVKYGAVSVADGYDIFVSECSKTFKAKPVVSVEKTKTRVSIEKIFGKKLNPRQNYKMIVKAYRLVNGKKEYIAAGKDLHIAGKKSRYTNVKKLTVKKKSVILTVGNKAKISAKITKENRRKKLLNKEHTAMYRYWSTNKKVAVVSKDGVILAKGTGSCKVYVMTANGKKAKVNVTVK